MLIVFSISVYLIFNVMQVFKSSFSVARRLDASRYCVVSISRRAPRNLNCVRCSSLAPSAELLSEWHGGLSKEVYEKRYRAEIASIFDLHSVFESLAVYCKGRDMVLCCYEADSKFCHRNILASIVFEKWGYQIQELSC